MKERMKETIRKKMAFNLDESQVYDRQKILLTKTDDRNTSLILVLFSNDIILTFYQEDKRNACLNPLHPEQRVALTAREYCNRNKATGFTRRQNVLH